MMAGKITMARRTLSQKITKYNQKDPYYSKKDTLRWHEANFQIIQVFLNNLLRLSMFLRSNASTSHT